MEFLGLDIDTRNLQNLILSLPPVKVESIVTLCSSLLSQNQVQLRGIAKVLGYFSWSIPTVSFAQGHSRRLQHFNIRSLQCSKDLSSIVSRGAFRLGWITSSNETARRFSLLVQTCLFISDVSLQGCGAVCDGNTTRGPWPLKDRSRHINEVELLGVLYAIQTFTKGSHDISVYLHLDNSTASSVCQ